MPKRTNQGHVRLLGKRVTSNHTATPHWVFRDLCRICDGQPKALAVYGFLLSHQDGWRMSQNEIARALGWGANAKRVRTALDLLEAKRLVVVQEHVRPDGVKLNVQDYILNADATPLTDEEVEKWSKPIVVVPRGQ